MTVGRNSFCEMPIDCGLVAGMATTAVVVDDGQTLSMPSSGSPAVLSNPPPGSDSMVDTILTSLSHRPEPSELRTVLPSDNPMLTGVTLLLAESERKGGGVGPMV